jgi:hypothetical protein
MFTDFVDECSPNKGSAMIADQVKIGGTEARETAEPIAATA